MKPRTDPRSALACRLLGAMLALLAMAGPVIGAEEGGKILLRLRSALKRGDEAERRAAVNDVGRLSGHLDRDQSMKAAKTLRGALDREASSEIRRLMIRALARFKLTHAWLPVIWASQSDRDPAVKDQARQEVLSGGGDFFEVMRKILDEETSASFRAELLLMLRDRRRPDAAPTLIERLEDPSLIVRAAAAEALEAVSGEAHGLDRAAWQAWHERWLAARPQDGGPTVSTGGRVKEPPPHVTRSLQPLLYGLRLTAKDIVFVIDISGSVGSGGVGRAKQQLAKAVSQLGSDVRMAALFFAEDTHMWRDGAMVPASPANKEDLVKFLRGLDPGRKTDLYTSLNAGLKIVEHRIEEKRSGGETFTEPVALVVVSDGRDNMANVPQRVIADKMERLDPTTSVLHCVLLGRKKSPLLEALARLGGGHYIRAEKP